MNDLNPAVFWAKLVSMVAYRIGILWALFSIADAINWVGQ